MAYCTLTDLRDEGFAKCDVTDRRAQSKLDDAAALIESLLGQWFEPRALTIRVDGRGTSELLLETPIISVAEVRVVNFDGTLQEPIPATEYVVYNRHLSMGLLNPDDRQNPRIAFTGTKSWIAPGHPLPGVTRSERFFHEERQNFQILGRFGYTDPSFAVARAIASGVGDALTAPKTLKMVNAAFTGADVGATLTITGAVNGANNAARTIAAVLAADTVELTPETIVTEAAGFTASIAAFPQTGVTPRAIKQACLLLAAKNMATLSERDATDLASGRIESMSVRDQSLKFSEDPRISSGMAYLTGDPEVDALLIGFRRQLSLGAA